MFGRPFSQSKRLIGWQICVSFGGGGGGEGVDGDDEGDGDGVRRKGWVEGCVGVHCV